MMDFAIFAVAFNLLKLHRIMENTKKNCSKSQLKDAFLPYYIIFVVKFIEFEKVEESGRKKLAYAA